VRWGHFGGEGREGKEGDGKKRAQTHSIDETLDKLILVHFGLVCIVVDQACDSPETEELSFSNAKEVLL